MRFLRPEPIFKFQKLEAPAPEAAGETLIGLCPAFRTAAKADVLSEAEIEPSTTRPSLATAL